MQVSACCGLTGNARFGAEGRGVCVVHRDLSPIPHHFQTKPLPFFHLDRWRSACARVPHQHERNREARGDTHRAVSWDRRKRSATKLTTTRRHTTCSKPTRIRNRRHVCDRVPLSPCPLCAAVDAAATLGTCTRLPAITRVDTATVGVPTVCMEKETRKVENRNTHRYGVPYAASNKWCSSVE